MTPLRRGTLGTVDRIFNALDYAILGEIYCDEGGDAFWEERRGPTQKLGIQFAAVLRARLRPRGRSLYVGAGVAEIPAVFMETLELEREVIAVNLRAREVDVLNRAVAGTPVHFHVQDARTVEGMFDHLWIVSVLNDPECFPELGALSSGRANPVTFDAQAFIIERQAVSALAADCLQKLIPPALVTTSIEEIVWVTDWCDQHNITYSVEAEDYPTAIVGDPMCLIRIG